MTDVFNESLKISSLCLIDELVSLLVLLLCNSSR